MVITLFDLTSVIIFFIFFTQPVFFSFFFFSNLSDTTNSNSFKFKQVKKKIAFSNL